MQSQPKMRRLVGGVARLLVASLLASGIGCGGDDDSGANSDTGIPNPVLEGPVTGGMGMPFLGTTMFDLAQVGYAEAEYFVSGTATAYTNVGDLLPDGMWQVTPGATADYKTRIVVYRPLDRRDFNGTVIVEWLNVSGGVDAGADWIMGHVELIREGYAWVGVSAQFVGVEGGAPILPGFPSMSLKEIDPERYGSLVHPGDSFAFDIFSQVAQSVRHPEGLNPLGDDLKIRAVIAAGESQSAIYMVTYINAFQPLFHPFDGYLVHSRAGFTAPLSQSPQTDVPAVNNARIRGDLDVPVLTFQTETDLFGILGSHAARQADSDLFRLWEVAGTSHADTYTTVVGSHDLGDDPGVVDLVLTTEPLGTIDEVEGLDFECSAPINSGPQHFVLNAAIAALNEWVRNGTPPPSAPRLDVDPGPPAAIVRDANGNALGGVRTPQTDVPIATLSGEGQVGTLFCLLFGSTEPFDEELLASLYPDPETYVAAVDEAADRAVEEGFLLEPDAELIKTNARQSGIGTD